MVKHSLKVDQDGDSLRLDVYLTQNLADIPSRTFIKKLIDHGHVKVNERVVKAHYAVEQNDDIIVEIPVNFQTPQYVEPQNIPLNIFFQDQYLLVINKRSGMLVHPAQGRHTDTLVNALKFHSVNLSTFNDEMIRPGIVHRLDQETSGLMLIAKDNITHTKLAKQFQRRTVKKQYVALVEREIEFDEGVVEVPIGTDPRHKDKKMVSFNDAAKAAKTIYKVLKRQGNCTLVALFPHTGRTHQLRVHMKYLGHPILGDAKYGKKNNFARLALHAQSIGFQHPASKKWHEFVSKIPREFLIQDTQKNI